MSLSGKTPRGLRMHIGLFGRRNAGKSSLLNAFTRQKVSIVSEIAGTTTDPVEKPMELLPLGPVLFIDTAGLDDEGILGKLRVEKTRKALERVDVALLVAEGMTWTELETAFLQELEERKLPAVVVFTKTDIAKPPSELLASLEKRGVRYVLTSSVNSSGMEELKEALLAAAPSSFMEERKILSDMVPPGSFVILVVPIDKEAPKGRIILPQVQTIRDLLDGGVISLVTGERELSEALSSIKVQPHLVVTDSQAFKEVAAIVPDEIPVTSFSILFARFKGDLVSMAAAIPAVDTLKSGDRILVAESCTHHPIGEDIARVKIPRWLEKKVGGKLEFTYCQGHDFPEDLTPYRLIVQCGACMTNRRAVLSRLYKAQKALVPMTNYGLLIAYTLGILERALRFFPEALEAFKNARGKQI